MRVSLTLFCALSFSLFAQVPCIGPGCPGGGGGSGLADPGSNGIIKRTALNTTAPATGAIDYVIPGGAYGTPASINLVNATNVPTTITATAGSTGVTANLTVSKTIDDPVTYVTSTSVASNCFIQGFSATTTTSGVSFQLQISEALVTAVADNAIVAGHILGCGTSTAGRVRDLGTASRAGISNSITVLGVAQQSASAGQSFSMLYDGVPTRGATVDVAGVSVLVDPSGACTVNSQALNAVSGVSWLCSPSGWVATNRPAQQISVTTVTIPFESASGGITIPGYFTAMVQPSQVACYDLSQSPITCTFTTSANALNSAYYDVVVSWSGSKSGDVLVTGTQKFTYYLDTYNGSDSNLGTIPTAPFKSIGAVPALSAGQTLGVATNSRPRAALNGTCLGYVLPASTALHSYGAGSPPLWDGSQPIVASAWTASGGHYVANVTVDCTTSTSEVFNIVWENGVHLTSVASTGLVDSTPGSYFVSIVDGTHFAVNIHSSDGSSPITNGYLYETQTQGEPLFAGNNSAVVGQWTRRNMAGNGSLETGSGVMVINSRASDGHKHNALFGPGTQVFNFLADGAYYGTNGPTPIVNFGTFAGTEKNIYHNLSVTIPNPAPNGTNAMFTHGAGGAQGTYYIRNPYISLPTSGGLVTVGIILGLGDVNISGGYINTSEQCAQQGTSANNLTVSNLTCPIGGIHAGGNAVSISNSTIGAIEGQAAVVGHVTMTNSTILCTDPIIAPGIGILLANASSTFTGTGNVFSNSCTTAYSLASLSEIQSGTDTQNFGKGLQNVIAASTYPRIWEYQEAAPTVDQASSPPVPSVANPLFHWKFNDSASGTATTVADSSGRAFAVPVNAGTPTWTADGLARIAGADVSTADTYFKETGSSLLTAASMSAVFKTTSLAATQVLIGRSNSSFVILGIYIDTAGKLHAAMRSGAGVITDCATSTGVISTNTYYMAHAAWGAGAVNLYLNGNSTAVATCSTSGSIDTNNRTWALGNQGGPTAGLTGTLADGQVWDFALSGANVATSYANTKTLLSTTHSAISLP